jgi:hypothetical protein
MWPFRKKRIVPVFGGLIGALKAKDAALFEVLGHLPAHLFWREWKKTYPEDFPQGGQSVFGAASIMPKRDAA